MTKNPVINKISSLPFIIKPISTPKEAKNCLKFRHEQYSRKDYNPTWQQSMLSPDSQDLYQNSVTLIALDKQSLEIIGTMRVTHNIDNKDFLKSYFEKVNFQFEGCFSYLDRFAISPSADPLTGPALMKASWLWIKACNVPFVFALAQRPFLRIYDKWGGLTLRGSDEGLIIPEFSSKKYYLIGASVLEGESQMALKNPEFYYEFYPTIHPDIQILKEGFNWKKIL